MVTKDSIEMLLKKQLCETVRLNQEAVSKMGRQAFKTENQGLTELLKGQRESRR